MSRRKEMYLRRRRDVALVGELQRQQREHDRHQRLTGDLGLAAQAERPLVADLEPVVQEPHRAQPGEQEQDQHRRHRRRRPGEHVAADVGDQHRRDDHQAAHRGGAALDVVGGRTVVADQLAVAPLDQHGDGQPSAEQGAEQGQAARENDRLHALPSPCSSLGPLAGVAGAAAARAVATVSKAKPREALTRTTSPGASPADTRRTASSRSVATSTLTPVPVASAPALSSSAKTPIATNRLIPWRAAYAPSARCSAGAEEPSSSMSPRTAQPTAPLAGALPDHAGHGVQSGAHRLRVGVVGIVDDQDPVRPLRELHPPSGPRPGRREPRHDRVRRRPERSGHGDRRDGVRHLVPAGQPQPDPNRLAPLTAPLLGEA